MYGSYAVVLRQRMNYTLTEEALIGSAIQVGVYCPVILTGLIYIAVGRRHAPKVLASLFLAFQGVGFFLAWGCSLKMWYTPGWAFALVYVLMGFGGSCAMNLAVVVNSRNFPLKSRGRVIGTLTCFHASGGLIFALVFEACNPDLPKFFVVMGCLTVFAGILGIIFMKEGAPRESQFPPTALRQMSDAPTTTKLDELEQALIDAEEEAAQHAADSSASGQTAAAQLPVTKRPAVKDIHGAMLLRQPHFYVLIISFMLGNAACFAVGNNIDAIMESMQSAQKPFYIVGSNAVGNMISRILVGFLSDEAKRRGISRVVWIVCAQCILCAMFIVLAMNPGTVIGVASIIGFCFGLVMTCTLTTLSEQFGTLHQTTNNGLFYGSIGVGIIILQQSGAALYNAQAFPNVVCYGALCWRTLMIICAAATGACFLLVLGLAIYEKRTTRESIRV
eukprot:TRINITY_DN6688_c0_g1_i1.p1 TRINITY_DN6688_c0_g1~~TRINITY_DN6688_c0_g1_i1.p1  ORF type:complete len:447 (+),score=64.27 TRINITY_DN6688_c0_g1_i1:63-1403(+)